MNIIDSAIDLIWQLGRRIEARKPAYRLINAELPSPPRRRNWAPPPPPPDTVTILWAGEDMLRLVRETAEPGQLDEVRIGFTFLDGGFPTDDGDSGEGYRYVEVVIPKHEAIGLGQQLYRYGLNG